MSLYLYGSVRLTSTEDIEDIGGIDGLLEKRAERGAAANQNILDFRAVANQDIPEEWSCMGEPGLEAMVAMRVAFYNPGAWKSLWPPSAAA